MKNKAVKDLAEIRQLMEKSTRYMSLSGWAGIWAGIFALVGSIVAYYLVEGYFHNNGQRKILDLNDVIFILLPIAIAVLVASIGIGFLTSFYKAKRDKSSLFTPASKKFIWNFFSILLIGALFCIAFFYRQAYGFIGCTTLLFYGLAILNVQYLTYSMVKYLGYFFVVLGILSAFNPGWGIFLWPLGFGLGHIVYGILFLTKKS